MGNPVARFHRNPKREIFKKKKTLKRRTPYRFRETCCEICQIGWRTSQKHLEHEEVLASRDAPTSTSRESDSEPPLKLVSRKHSIFSHFPKERICEVWKRTKITRAPCRQRTGDAVPRAEHFGDLITADHKVLSEGCEARNNHRYAVVVQDSAAQRLQSYPCKTKTSQETEKKFTKVLRAVRKSQKSLTQTIPWNLATLAKNDHGIHCASTPHRSETNGIAERPVLLAAG